jgi:hypothetical protein
MNFSGNSKNIKFLEFPEKNGLGIVEIMLRKKSPVVFISTS